MKQEARDLDAMIKESGETHELAPWDWEYYAEKVRKARYQVDEAAIRPYFELNSVLKKCPPDSTRIEVAPVPLSSRRSLRRVPSRQVAKPKLVPATPMAHATVRHVTSTSECRIDAGRARRLLTFVVNL